MRILFLTHYYPPEVNAPANRVHEHARVWAKDGHEVTVITGVPNHPRGEVFPGYQNRWFQEEWLDGVHVVRTWMYLWANEGFARRTLNYLLFAVTAVLASLRVARPDVVVATSPQFFCGLAGAMVSWIKWRPFVLEIRDLWPDSIVQLGRLEPGAIMRALAALESLLYRSARAIVVVTRAFEAHIRRLGIQEERIHLVYNGIDVQRFQPREPDLELLERHGLKGRFTVAYVGTLGLAHGLTTLLETADRFRDEPGFQFLLIGDGADRQALEARVAELSLESVHFLGLLPRDQIPSWLASIDVLLVMLRDLPVFETVIPSKIFEYLAMERPVILAAKGEIRAMVAAEDAATIIDPEDPEALARAVRTIHADSTEARSKAAKGRSWVQRDFRRDDLARRMAQVLEEAVGRRA